MREYSSYRDRNMYDAIFSLVLVNPSAKCVLNSDDLLQLAKKSSNAQSEHNETTHI